MCLFPITQQQINQLNKIELSNFDNPDLARSTLFHLLSLGYTPWNSNNEWKCYSKTYQKIVDIEHINQIWYINFFIEGTNKCVFGFYTNGYFETKTKRQCDGYGYQIDENKLFQQWNINKLSSSRYRTTDIKKIIQIKHIIHYN